MVYRGGDATVLVEAVYDDDHGIVWLHEVTCIKLKMTPKRFLRFDPMPKVMKTIEDEGMDVRLCGCLK